MTDTPKLGLTYLEGSQAQKHVTVNDALRHLDGVVQASAADKDLTAPPGSPTTGDAYIVASGASGLWAGHEGELAVWHDTAWFFYAPAAGWLVYVEDESTLYVYDGASWDTISSALTGASIWGVNATADTSNRLSVTSPGVLFNAETDDIALAMNKATATDDARILFETGFSGRALIGLLGSDDFSFTVSPDGSTYTQALTIDKDTAAVDLPQHPKFSGYCNHDQYNAAGAWFKVDVNVLRHNDQAAVSGGTFTAPHDGYYAFGAKAKLKLNVAAPTSFSIGLSVNGATPTADATVTEGQADSPPVYANGKVIGSSGVATSRGATVVRNSTGRYTVTLNTALPSADYVILATVTGVAGVYSDIKPVVESQATGSFIINTLTGDNSASADVAKDSDFFFVVYPPADYVDYKPEKELTALLKLTAGDTVELNAMFETNDGYVEADNNYFWGAQIP